MSSMERNSHIRQLISVLLFLIYIGVLVYFLFFSELMGRTVGNEYHLNLILFKEIRRFYNKRHILGDAVVWMNIAGNIAAFIPFGLFVMPVSNRRINFLEAVILTFNVSLCVEIIQLVTKVGSFDVDDLFLNTIGGMIGAGIYVVYAIIERKRTNGKVQI